MVQWRGKRRSTNVEHRRGGGRGVMKLSGGMIIIVLIISLLTGQNPLGLLQMLTGGGSNVSGPQTQSTGPDRNAEEWEYVQVILASTEDVWSQQFRQRGGAYQAPTLVRFEGSVSTACGFQGAATGPFYCPGDRKVYMDLGFFRQLKQLGAPGDFAQAYVIGHEVGHHIQTITGINSRVREMQRNARSKADANQAQVKMELQADCYAGVWAYHSQQQYNWLEPGDVQEGLQAAASIGDDALQRRSGGTVRPESFTHGTSAQRQQWLQRGLQSGDMNACDTFGFG